MEGVRTLPDKLESVTLAAKTVQIEQNPFVKKVAEWGPLFEE